MSINSVAIPRWFDRHLHIRDGEMMQNVLPCTLKQQAAGALLMGNLKDEPITTIERARAYQARIKKLIPEDSDFRPLTALYLTDQTTPEEVVSGFDQGLWPGVKLMMTKPDGKGGSTGSEHAVQNLLGRYPVFEAMQKRQIPLFGHFEAVEDNVDVFDREIVSKDRHLKPILRSFPCLPVVFEHITDGRVADFVAEVDHEIYATVTAHHPIINRNAMYIGGMNPINYCLPVAKREEDRLKIRKYMTSGHPRFGAGTDSAPHDESAKSRYCGCAAGIFTAPMAVELYTAVFDEDDALENLGAFMSENFLHIYGMEVSKETMTIERTPLVVPEKIGGVQVFKEGGSVLPWKLRG